MKGKASFPVYSSATIVLMLIALQSSAQNHAMPEGESFPVLKCSSYPAGDFKYNCKFDSEWLQIGVQPGPETHAISQEVTFTLEANDSCFTESYPYPENLQIERIKGEFVDEQWAPIQTYPPITLDDLRNVSIPYDLVFSAEKEIQYLKVKDLQPAITTGMGFPKNCEVLLKYQKLNPNISVVKKEIQQQKDKITSALLTKTTSELLMLQQAGNKEAVTKSLTGTLCALHRMATDQLIPGQVILDEETGAPVETEAREVPAVFSRDDQRVGPLFSSLETEYLKQTSNQFRFEEACQTEAAQPMNTLECMDLGLGMESCSEHIRVQAQAVEDLWEAKSFLEKLLTFLEGFWDSTKATINELKNEIAALFSNADGEQCSLVSSKVLSWKADKENGTILLMPGKSLYITKVAGGWFSGDINSCQEFNQISRNHTRGSNCTTDKPFLDWREVGELELAHYNEDGSFAPLWDGFSFKQNAPFTNNSDKPMKVFFHINEADEGIADNTGALMVCTQTK